MPTSPFSVDARLGFPASFYAAAKLTGELVNEPSAHLYRLPLLDFIFPRCTKPKGRFDIVM